MNYEETITGWVARQPDGKINLSMEKPFWRHTRWFSYQYLELEDYDTPIKWTDEPVKVEITIRRTEK